MTTHTNYNDIDLKEHFAKRDALGGFCSKLYKGPESLEEVLYDFDYECAYVVENINREQSYELFCAKNYYRAKIREINYRARVETMRAERLCERQKKEYLKNIITN